MRVLVTGGNGFVGRVLLRDLAAAGTFVRAAVRRTEGVVATDVRAIADLGEVDWGTLVDGIDVVFHLAARAHVLKETSSNPRREFQRTNVEATRRLIEACMSARVARIVYLSSVKVMGESSARPFVETDAEHPQDEYGKSKADAEEAIRSAGAHIEHSILRAPLVYGPHVGGNFRSLLDAVARRLPLPLGAVKNQRSLIFVENLTNALLHLATGSRGNQTYFARDGADVSTRELIEKLSLAMGRSPRLFNVRPQTLRVLAHAMRRTETAERLLGSLQVNDAKLRESGWHPPFTLEEGLRLSAVWYLDECR